MRYTLLALFTSLLVSCSAGQEGGLHDGHREIAFSLELDAIETDETRPGEVELHEVGVYIFNTDGDLELSSGMVKAEDLNVTRWFTYEGMKDIYVVVNPGDQLKAVLMKNSKLPAMQATTTETITNENDFIATISSIPENGLMMTGTLHVNLTSKINTVTVQVKRRIARIDLSIRKSKELTDELNITSVTLDRTRIACSLFNDTWKSAVPASTSKDIPAEMLSADDSQDGIPIEIPVGDTYVPVSRSYTYPVQNNGNSVPDNEACLLQISATLSGIPVTYSTYIMDSNLNTNLINPNTIYKVKATLTPQHTLEVLVSPLPWEVEDEQTEELDPTEN